MNQPRETAGVTTKLILAYARSRGGEPAVRRVLEVAGTERSPTILENEHGWSSYDQKIALFAAAAEVLGEPDVAVRVGESVLASTIGAPVRMLVRALGSPREVLRNVARVSPKFSTVCTMTAVSADRNQARITYQLHDGYTPSHFDCDYNIGLISQASVLFGLPPARVRHDECQVHGAERCVYDVRWTPRRRLLGRKRARCEELERRLETVTARSEDLQSTVADLVSADDVESVLARIASRAGVAVRAQAYVLALRGDDGEVGVTSDGIDEGEALALAEILLDPGAADDPSMLIVDVVSARQAYGRLAALFPRGGSFFPEERRLFEAYARNAAVALDVATAMDAERHQVARLHSQAYRDPVTGLPNRRLFDDRFAQSIAHAVRSGNGIAILYLDLDRFKEVNDSLGHIAGDRLLYDAGERLAACLRREDTLARVGGDEFAVILPSAKTPEDAEAVARKIIDTMAKPFFVAGTRVQMAVSIGSARCRDDGTDPRVLLNKADRAMYAAKSARHGYRAFDPAVEITGAMA